MNKLIIAFTAPKQTGKTTACRAIEAQHAANTHSFADPLKEFGKLIFPAAFMNEGKEQVFAPVGFSYRDFAVHTGDTWRKLNQDVFINILKHRVELSNSNVILIDDLRYENEAKAIREMGGLIVRLSREGIEYTGEHATEQALDNSLIDDSVDVNNVVEIVSLLIDNWEKEEEEE